MNGDFESENLGHYRIIKDVDFDHWAYNYIVSTSNYINYSDGLFRPNDYITREDAAYALAKRIKPNVNKIEALSQFNDADEISDNNREFVEIAVASGIINGYGDGRLNPKGSLTRAQVCTLIYNIKYKLNLYHDYLNFADILKCLEITTNLNGDDKDLVKAEFVFDVDSIKDISGYVMTTDNRRIDAQITYGRTTNGKFEYMPCVTFSFYAKPEEDYRIWITKLTTKEGQTTADMNYILGYDPDGRFNLKYSGTINKNTIFKYSWSDQYRVPSQNVEWHLKDSNIFGVISNDEFSIAKDVIKSVNKASLNKTIDVTIVAEDDGKLDNCLYIYKYNIFGIKK